MRKMSFKKNQILRYVLEKNLRWSIIDDKRMLCNVECYLMK